MDRAPQPLGAGLDPRPRTNRRPTRVCALCLSRPAVQAAPRETPPAAVALAPDGLPHLGDPPVAGLRGRGTVVVPRPPGEVPKVGSGPAPQGKRAEVALLEVGSGRIGRQLLDKVS